MNKVDSSEADDALLRDDAISSQSLPDIHDYEEYDLYEELCRIAPLDGVALLQLVEEDEDAVPLTSLPADLHAEVTFLSRRRNAGLTRCLSEHFGVSTLPSTVVFRNRHLVTVVEGPLTGPRAVSLSCASPPSVVPS